MSPCHKIKFICQVPVLEVCQKDSIILGTQIRYQVCNSYVLKPREEIHDEECGRLGPHQSGQLREAGDCESERSM